MTTVAEVVEEVNATLHSYTGIREQVTYLTSEMSNTTLKMDVNNGSRVTQGYVEVGDELVEVNDVDEEVVTLLPDGRGRRQSEAQTHPKHTRVTNDPMFSQSGILRTLAHAVASMHPQLFRVKTTEIVFNPAKFSYELPEDVDRVLEVRYGTPGPSDVWPQAGRWNFIRSANSGDFPSGKALDVYEPITPGYTMHVTYAGPYGRVTSPEDTLEDLGIQESVRDVLLYGTCWRLAQGLTASRLHMHAVEQMARQEAVPPDAHTNLSRQFFSIYAQRLAEERRRLLALHPQQIHRTR